MKKELMALSALSSLVLSGCVSKSQQLAPADLDKKGELIFIDLPDISDNKAYYYINTDQTAHTAEYVGYKYVEDRTSVISLLPERRRMPISKWRENLVDIYPVPSVERVKE